MGEKRIYCSKYSTSAGMDRRHRRPFATVAALPVLLTLLFLAACQSVPREPPTTVIEDAHGGGAVLAIDPAGRRVASGGWSGWLRIWRLEDGRQLTQWRAHRGTVNGLVWLDERHLLSAGHDGRIVLWSVEGQSLRQWSTDSPVSAFDWHRASDRFASGHNDGSVRLWALNQAAPLKRIAAHRRRVRAVTFSPDGRQLASSGEDGQVALIDDDGLGYLPPPSSDARELLFSVDGTTLYGSGWFRLFRWRLAERGLDELPTEHHGIINDLKWVPGQHILASISRQTDSAVLWLDPDNGRTLRRFEKHRLCGTRISFSSDGRYQASTSDDASIRIWRLEKTGR